MHEQNPLQLDDSLKRKVEACAQANGVTPDQVIRQAVEEYLSVHEANGGKSATAPRRLADIADSIAATVPAEEWAKLPPDLAKNFEHYRYDYPRED